MRIFLTVLLCIFCLNAGAQPPQHSPVVTAWRAQIIARLALLLPGPHPGYPDGKKLVRTLGLTHPNHGTMVVRGDVPFSLKHATALAGRYDVDREWVLAADHLHEIFATYDDLKAATANETRSVADVMAEAYLAFDEARAATWATQYQGPFSARRHSDEPYLTVAHCDSQLTDFSGTELLQLQLAITTELIKRNGNVR